MIAEGILESGSEKPRRGRPRSWRRNLAEDLRRRGLSPEDCRCERSRMNNAYRLTATGPALRLLTAEEHTILFGATDDDLRRSGTFPRGWDSAALELGRLLHGIDADDDTARRFLLIAVDARRDGISWRDIRSHFRKLRLGERCGNAVSLLLELSRTVDAYRSRFPATTDQMIAGAARSLLELFSGDCDCEPVEQPETDRLACD